MGGRAELLTRVRRDELVESLGIWALARRCRMGRDTAARARGGAPSRLGRMTSAELEVPIERIEESVKGILDLVSSGGSCILTQGGKPVARVVPINDETEDAWRLQAAEIEAAQEARPHNMQD